MDDPNNTNTSPVNTGANDRQAIFTPQPEAPTAQETPSMSASSEVTPQPAASTSTVTPTPPTNAHPFISNHPTQTFNSNTGDIILGGAAPKTKQNKRPFIIGAIVLIAFTIIVTVVLIFTSNQASESNIYHRTKVAFLEYASFILKGEASSGELDTSCVANNSCYFLQAMQSEEEAKAFFAESAVYKNKLDEIINSSPTMLVYDVDGSDPTDITLELQDVIKIYDFLKVYASRTILKKNDIIQHYLLGGSTDMQDYIENYYDFDYVDNIYLEQLKESISAMGMAVAENIELYAKYNCMEQFMNTMCFQANATDEDKDIVAENDQAIANYGAEMNSYADMLFVFIDDIVGINNLFNMYERVGLS